MVLMSHPRYSANESSRYSVNESSMYCMNESSMHSVNTGIALMKFFKVS